MPAQAGCRAQLPQARLLLSCDFQSLRKRIERLLFSPRRRGDVKVASKAMQLRQVPALARRFGIAYRRRDQFESLINASSAKEDFGSQSMEVAQVLLRATFPHVCQSRSDEVDLAANPRCAGPCPKEPGIRSEDGKMLLIDQPQYGGGSLSDCLPIAAELM